MKKRGFNEVYQIDGGIVRYGEQFGNDGLGKVRLQYLMAVRRSISRRVRKSSAHA